MPTSLCAIDCTQCPMRPSCKGCVPTHGCPFGEPCAIAEHPSLKSTLITLFNALHIPDLPAVTDLYPLKGSTVNLTYPLPGGQNTPFWNDNAILLGAQLPKRNTQRCYGLAANERYLMVSEYDADGSQPEIVLFQRWTPAILPVDASNLDEAAAVHSASWQASHRGFCTEDFIRLHTPEHQKNYLQEKLKRGAKLYLIAAPDPAGVVCVDGSLIEDLYILPEFQNQGLGTRLLQFAERQCPNVPTLWILENNENARRLYERFGYHPTGKINAITGKLNEIEFQLKGE